MVSLSYFDEHLAWQQRVQKEISVAYRINPQSRETNKKFFYKFVPGEVESDVPSTRGQLLPNLGNLNVYAEVRGKYARQAFVQNTVELPHIRSRTSTAAISNILSRKSSTGKESVIIEDAEGKSVLELQKMLRQERLRRMIAERELKRKAAQENNN
ncbi:hypothetical protein SteCoe_36241 [Stentor coeruleus]|uniref:Uncharacterized protein n=1 Tax=Stentor coeruleus TaxID=5963 RepID=A0A1R2AQV6_9CILI|nr:hypothetical protein SteCoe_36241 [Stentor coeruleus]